MSAGIMIMGLFMVFLPIINIQIAYVEDVHYRYMLERSLKSATLAAYEKDTVEASFDEFQTVFKKTYPQNFEVSIELLNYEKDPRFVHYKIKAENDKGYTYEMEESIIEEVKE